MDDITKMSLRWLPLSVDILLVAMLLNGAGAEQIASYHLNKHLPLSAQKCSACPNIECVYLFEDNATLRMPDSLSICFRWMATQVLNKNL